MDAPTILVVEDNETHGYVLKQLCELFDYNVHTVTSAEAALDALACHVYAAVLLDIGLPGMNGFECAHRIRLLGEQWNRHIPVIAVTGRHSEEDRQRCLAEGIDGYVAKPFTAETLRIMLLRHAYQPHSPNLKLLKPHQISADADSKSAAKTNPDAEAAGP